MNWPGFSALGSAWLFLLLGPLILFYFLKLRRPRVEIPSLALWQSVISDRRVNSPFQRFKRNLLLLLQIICLCCLVIAAMQPFLLGQASQAERLPVLVDCSASMTALDAPGGRSRLDVAKAEVRKLIDNLLPGQELSLISVGSSARRLADFTSNQRVLHAALNDVQVVEAAGELEDALRMAQALSRNAPIKKVLLLTDGNVPERIEFELPFELSVQTLPAGGRNMGITELSARRTGRKEWNIFVRVEGSTLSRMSAALELWQDGRQLGRELLALEKGETRRIAFAVTPEGRSSIEVRLQPQGFDSLAADNVAFLELPAIRPLAVYCSPSLSTYRHALSAHEEIALFPSEAEAEAETRAATAAPPRVDLLIADHQGEDLPEAAVALYVGVVPQELRGLVGVREQGTQVVDWDRSNPLLQHVQLAEVLIAEEPVSGEGVRENEFEESGFEVLAHGGKGPLLVQRRRGASQEFYLLFHSDKSTLPYRLGFPILVANLLQVALTQAELSEIRAPRTGLLPAVTVQEGQTYQIQWPDGTVREAISSAEGRLAGVAAPLVGRYEVRREGETTARVGVSLLDRRESSLAAVPKLTFKEISVAASAAVIDTDKPLWRWFACLGFAALLAEWWLFQRRPGRGEGKST